MARQKKKPVSEVIVEATRESIVGKLHKMTTLQLERWLVPLIDGISEEQQARIRKLAAAAQAVDPKWRDIFGMVAPSSQTRITSDNWRLSAFYISHKPICGAHPFEGARFLKGNLCFSGISPNEPEPEEVTLAYMTQATAAIQLPEWTKQFADAAGMWSDAALGRMCAFSPLYRMCLRIPLDIRKEGYELPVYKYGPRGLDEVKHMSPELVHALQIASNMEEEEVSF